MVFGQKEDNKDRLKVNRLEGQIFQQENLLKNWLQKSSVLNKIRKDQMQIEEINAEAQQYQDMVITKNDLIKGQNTARIKKPIN